tara:strand:- start:9195 stop:10163 length:969 start_codon:yes stop_codon:yes gene_type:complete
MSLVPDQVLPNSVLVPKDDVTLVINDSLELKFLHDRDVYIAPSKKFVTCTEKITSSIVPVKFSFAIYGREYSLNTQLSLTIKVLEDNVAVARKFVNTPERDNFLIENGVIHFECNIISGPNIDLLNKHLVLEIENLCDTSEAICCVNEIDNFEIVPIVSEICVPNPCDTQYTLPMILRFASYYVRDRITVENMETGEMLLDTGLIGTDRDAPRPPDVAKHQPNRIPPFVKTKYDMIVNSWEYELPYCPDIMKICVYAPLGGTAWYFEVEDSATSPALVWKSASGGQSDEAICTYGLPAELPDNVFVYSTDKDISEQETIIEL